MSRIERTVLRGQAAEQLGILQSLGLRLAAVEPRPEPGAVVLAFTDASSEHVVRWVSDPALAVTYIEVEGAQSAGWKQTIMASGRPFHAAELLRAWRLDRADDDPELAARTLPYLGLVADAADANVAAKIEAGLTSADTRVRWAAAAAAAFHRSVRYRAPLEALLDDDVPEVVAAAEQALQAIAARGEQ